MRFIDLTNQKFGKLTAKYIDHQNTTDKYWYCECDCGGKRIVAGGKLRNHSVTDCGCQRKRPSNFVDLAGMVFGKLTVIEEYKGNDKDRVHWVCQCNCIDNTKLIVPTSNLTSGHTTKCKKCVARDTSKRCLIDLTGERFGRLVVIGRAPNYISPSGDTNTRWNCHCDCGNDVVVPQSGLRSQGTISCGCYRKEVVSENMLEDLTGQKFGMFTVVDRGQNLYHPNGGYSVVWNCVCDCGGKISVQAGNLKNGHTTSCGCLSSKGEARICQYLINNHIDYKPQYTFSDCTYKGILRFDVGVLDCNNNLMFLCEFDGQQHYEPVVFGGDTYDESVEKYKQLIIRDNIKNNYCLENHIRLLRIPYWDYDNIDNILTTYIDKCKKEDGLI